MEQGYKPEHHPFVIGMGDNSPRDPNHVRRPYGTDCWLIEFTVLGNAAAYSINGTEYVFSKGDIFCYQAQVQQKYELYSKAKRWKHYWICFTPTEKWLPLLNWKELFPGFQMLSIKDEELFDQIEDVFKLGVKLTQSHYPQRYELMTNLVEQILLWAEIENPRNPHHITDERIRKSLSFIDRSLGRPLKIENLAIAAGLSVSRFAHLFQQTMGHSPLRYLERRRMDRAVELLLTTSEPVSRIANWVGYEDALYFSRAFRRTVRMSPRECRIKHSSIKSAPQFMDNGA